VSRELLRVQRRQPRRLPPPGAERLTQPAVHTDTQPAGQHVRFTLTLPLAEDGRGAHEQGGTARRGRLGARARETRVAARSGGALLRGEAGAAAVHPPTAAVASHPCAVEVARRPLAHARASLLLLPSLLLRPAFLRRRCPPLGRGRVAARLASVEVTRGAAVYRAPLRHRPPAQVAPQRSCRRAALQRVAPGAAQRRPRLGLRLGLVLTCWRCPPVGQQQRQHIDRLAQPHLIGEHAAAHVAGRRRRQLRRERTAARVPVEDSVAIRAAHAAPRALDARDSRADFGPLSPQHPSHRIALVRLERRPQRRERRQWHGGARGRGRVLLERRVQRGGFQAEC